MKLIADIKKLKTVSKNIKPKTQPKPKPKSYEEYFQECIKNNAIPVDTPSYLRAALQKAIGEHSRGIIKENSALAQFAEKYFIKGKFGVTAMEYFKMKAPILKRIFEKSPQLILK